ncbi:hypothetical protein C0995_000429 [Termitomyces sp. Mi166|nr:hypothetical protein C0995_000429 [Termitomyces sp. Mi166\
MALDWSSSSCTSINPFHFPPSRSFIIDVMLQSTGTTHAALINSGATGTFISSELALPSKEISELIELQLFDSTPAASGLITHHHFDIISLANTLDFPVDLLVTQLHCTTPIILDLPWLHDANSNIDWKLMTMTFKVRDAQLATSFSLKSRSAPTIKEVINEDCSEPPNPEFIHPPILVDLKGEKSVSTPPNPPSPQANTAQPQHNTIPLPTPSLTSSEPNIASPPCSCFFLPPHSFPPNSSWNRYKGLHRLQSPSPTIRSTSTKDAQDPLPPELPNSLDIRIISTAPFAWIIWEGAQAYQLHVSPSLPEEHLWADANVPASETKLEDQILHKAVPLEYHKYADIFPKGSAKELPPQMTIRLT